MPLDYFHTAALLGNLLSLPSQFEDQRRQSEATRALLTQFSQAGGPSFSPQEMEAYAPMPPNLGAGAQNFGGTIIRGVGTIGQVLQGVLGTAPPAPRPPIPELNALAEMQRRNRITSGRTKVADLIRSGAKPEEIRATALENSVPLANLGLATPTKPFSGERATIAAGLGVPLTGATAEQAQQVENTYDQKVRDRAKFTSALSVTTATEKAEKVGQIREDFKRQALSTPTKTMIESAPTVLHFVDRVDQLLDKVTAGPVAGRYQEFMTGTVGTGDPEFNRLRTDMVLLRRQLVRMHVGARQAEGAVREFQSILDEGRQTPELLRAALDEIRDYAKELLARGAQPSLPPAAGKPSAAAPTPAPQDESQQWHQMLDEMGVPK